MEVNRRLREPPLQGLIGYGCEKPHFPSNFMNFRHLEDADAGILYEGEWAGMISSSVMSPPE
jgi:hypothetical protein